MGKVLQIRVIAVTWDDEMVEDYWPRLAHLGFAVPIKLENHGVLELVRALGEGLRFGKWPADRKEALAPGITKAVAIKDELEKALSDWDPRRANELSNELEDTLDKLERS